MRGRAVVSVRQSMLWLAVALLLGCAGSSIRADGDRFAHERHGYQIGRPLAHGTPEWTRVNVDGADIAFRDGSGAILSLMSACKASTAAPQILAANLLLGLRPRQTITSGPYALGNAPGWHQTLLAGEDGRWVETVTIKAGGCVFDWILISPAENERLDTVRTSLEGWIETFRHPALDAKAPTASVDPTAQVEVSDFDGEEPL